MTDSDLFTPKHLARNVHEDFDGVCERIRLRDFSDRNREHRLGKRYTRMLEALGIEALSDGEAAEICGELDEISVRFLAIQVTIDKRVSVKTTFKELSRIQNTLQRAARNLDDPDIKSGITAVRAETLIVQLVQSY